jgi:hypothetical protein
LDWGEPIHSKQQIAAEFGSEPARRSLEMLTRAATVEHLVTRELVGSVLAGTAPYQLAHRVKSPQSLARKIRKFQDHRSPDFTPEDLLRYTVVAPEPDDLVDTARSTLERVQKEGWAMHSAHHSYLDGSRYKGLHTFLRCHDELVELQFHSRESIDVKERTTPLYVVERDNRLDKQVRDAARAECIALSETMRQPAGIDELDELGGVPVAKRVYGMRRSQPGLRPTADWRAAESTPSLEQQHPNLYDNKQTGMGR